MNYSCEKIILNKTRQNDFIWEVEHVIDLLDGRIKKSPISLDRGIETMCVIEALFRSSQERKPVKVNWLD